MTDPEAWDLVFRESIAQDYASICPVLPTPTACVLDVGSGVGTLDIMLNWHYWRNRACLPAKFVLVDALDAAPEVVVSHTPHSSARVARRYVAENSALEPADFSFWSPEFLKRGVQSWRIVQPFDLVISLGSWCFHYEPDTYLQAIMRLVHPETVFVLDVRTGRPSWEDQLTEWLEPTVVLSVAHNGKSRRVVYKPRRRANVPVAT